jgi:hypothetical protein
MPKYIVEGAIDFFSELYKSLDEKSSQFKTEEDDNLCLITNQPLTNHYVELLCGHKFNYIPLFKDIENHKKNFNNMENVNGKLGKNEIRCPYCRKKQNQLLPYYEDLGVPRVIGVNEQYIQSNDYSHWCEYMIPVTNPAALEALDISNNGVPHFIKCTYYGTPLYVCANNTNYGDTKKYCWQHKKIMILKYKKEIKEKVKAGLKLAKLKEKETAKKIKQEAKLKEKEEKAKAKAFANETQENTVISVSNIENNTGCIVILKSGLKKGLHCGANIFNHDEQLCKRHYNLAHKISVKDNGDNVENV